ncbi:MAG: GNAT family N-acetyltransferase [Burkholderiales bacterium]
MNFEASARAGGIAAENSTITLVPMSDAAYAAFAGKAIPKYAEEKVASGQWSREESLALSRKSLDELLPQGKDTPGNHLFTLLDGASTTVGTLWIAEQARAGRRIAYVYDVEIEPGHRRKGYAAQAFAAVERLAQELGLSGIALHVFGHNAAAQALYTKLGYAATSIHMFKPLTGEPG